MSRHLYHTHAIILASTPVKEADRFFQLLTKELGLIGAVAQGVRYMKSKLRYSLQEYAPARITLVRGKEVWRITSATSETWKFPEAYRREAVQAIARVAVLVRRMLHGEGAVPGVYEEFRNMAAFLESVSSVEDIGDVQMLVSLRILGHLGYVAPIGSLLSEEEYSSLMPKFRLHRKEVSGAITAALKASHL